LFLFLLRTVLKIQLATSVWPITNVQRSLMEMAPHLVWACKVGGHAQQDLDLATQNPATPNIELGEEGSIIAWVWCFLSGKG
jgi:hypothetical protein